MLLHEITEPRRDRIEKMWNAVQTVHSTKLMPTIDELSEFFVEQWPRPLYVRYMKALSNVAEGWRRISIELERMTQQERKKNPDYKFPAVVVDTLSKSHASMLKSSFINLKSIHRGGPSKWSGDTISYSGDNMDLDPQEVRNQMVELMNVMRSFKSKDQMLSVLNPPTPVK